MLRREAKVRTGGVLDIIACTINNTCPLQCEHCYLQVSGRGFMEPKTIAAVFEARPNKIAIVGMEPLADAQSVEIVRAIARRGHETGTFVSLVTSGAGIKKLCGLPVEDLPDAIDFSDHHDDDRKYTGMFRQISDGIQQLCREHPRLRVSAMYTLSEGSANIDAVLGRWCNLVTRDGEILFSPFVVPSIEKGLRAPSTVRASLDKLLVALACSRAFEENTQAKFFVSPYNAWDMGMRWQELVEAIGRHNVRARLEPTPPHENGSVRVTYDGRVLRPDFAFHTALHAAYGQPIGEIPLIQWYIDLLGLPFAHDIVQ